MGHPLPRSDVRRGAHLLLDGLAVWFIAIVYAGYTSADVGRAGQDVVSLIGETSFAWIRTTEVGFPELVGYIGLAVAIFGPAWYWVIKPVREHLDGTGESDGDFVPFESRREMSSHDSQNRIEPDSIPNDVRSSGDDRQSRSPDWMSNVFSLGDNPEAVRTSSAHIQDGGHAQFFDGGEPTAEDGSVIHHPDGESHGKSQNEDSVSKGCHEQGPAVPEESSAAEPVANGQASDGEGSQDPPAYPKAESGSSNAGRYSSEHRETGSITGATQGSPQHRNDERSTDPFDSLESTISASRRKLEGVSEKVDQLTHESRIETVRENIISIQEQPEVSIGPTLSQSSPD